MGSLSQKYRMMVCAAYAHLKHEYTNHFNYDTNPKKFTHVLLEKDGLPAIYANSMTARLSDGHFGSKLIYVDEEKGTTRANTIVHSSDGEVLVNCESSKLTSIRCGLMAALSAEIYFGNFNCDRMNVALYGLGKINVETANVLKVLFDVKRFYARGSEKNPTKNYDKIFEDATSVDSDDTHFAVVCTNNFDKKQMISRGSLSIPFPKPLLWITQDGGWFLDKTFRETHLSYTDHPHQIVREEYFPFDDDVKVREISCMRGMRRGEYRHPTCVYLTGIAMADLIIAIHAKEQGLLDSGEYCED